MLARRKLFWYQGSLTDDADSHFKYQIFSATISSKEHPSVLFSQSGKRSVLMLVTSQKSERTERLKRKKVVEVRNRETRP